MCGAALCLLCVAQCSWDVWLCDVLVFFWCYTWCSDAPCVMCAKILSKLCKHAHTMSSTHKVMSSSCVHFSII